MWYTIFKPGSIFKILNSLLEMFYYDHKLIKTLKFVLQYHGNMYMKHAIYTYMSTGYVHKNGFEVFKKEPSVVHKKCLVFTRSLALFSTFSTFDLI